jgi:hypothetical protein
LLIERENLNEIIGWFCILSAVDLKGKLLECDSWLEYEWMLDSFKLGDVIAVKEIRLILEHIIYILSLIGVRLLQMVVE